MPKVLIIRFSSIGDIVLTTPVIRCIKKQIPDADVHYLTKRRYKSLLIANPYIDQIKSLRKQLADTIFELRKEKYDYVIDLHHNLRTFLLKPFIHGQKKSFYKQNIEKWLYVKFKVNRLSNRHIVDRYMDTVDFLGVRNDGFGLDYFIPEEEYIPEEKIPPTHRKGFIVIVSGARYATKRIPVEKILLLLQHLQYPVVLLGDAADRRRLKISEYALNIKIPVWNACGKFSINESASILDRARVVITPDTGLMHIASALGKPIISVWGNTVPEFGMYPYFGHRKPGVFKIYEVKGLSCRPCSKLGYPACPETHFNCMEKQDILAIANNANQWFEGVPQRKQNHSARPANDF